MTPDPALAAAREMLADPHSFDLSVGGCLENVTSSQLEDAAALVLAALSAAEAKLARAERERDLLAADSAAWRKVAYAYRAGTPEQEAGA